MKSKLFAIFFVTLGGCQQDAAPVEADVTERSGTCYWGDDLDAFFESGGDVEGRGNIYNEYIDGDYLWCADEWEFTFPPSNP